MKFTCGNCGVELKARDDLAGKTVACPKCRSALHIPTPSPPAKPKIPPATERQKEYATSLGIQFPPDIDRKAISELIDRAVRERDDERFEKLDELSNRESAAWKSMRAEVLAEIDEDDCRLSTAQSSQMLDELARRNMGAILITFDWTGVDDLDELAGVKFGIEFSDDISESEMRSIMVWLGGAILRQMDEGST